MTRMAVNCNGAPPQNWLVDNRNSNLNNVHKIVPNYHSSPYGARCLQPRKHSVGYDDGNQAVFFAAGTSVFAARSRGITVVVLQADLRAKSYNTFDTLTEEGGLTELRLLRTLMQKYDITFHRLMYIHTRSD